VAHHLPEAKLQSDQPRLGVALASHTAHLLALASLPRLDQNMQRQEPRSLIEEASVASSSLRLCLCGDATFKKPLHPFRRPPVLVTK
jgi:hypothetical protein